MHNIPNQWIIRSEDLNSPEYRRFGLWSAAALLLAYSVILFDPFKNPDVLHILLEEDGVYESLTAVFFAIASVLFCVAWWRNRNIFLLLFTIVFFVGVGEEISWAQRILGYKTPDLIWELNTQKEFNLHNLKWLSKGTDSNTWMPTVGQLFHLFVLFYCVLTPIAAYASARINNAAVQIRLPIVNPWIAVFFPINYLIAKLIEITFPFQRLKVVEYYWEVTESVFSLLFALVAIDLMFRSARLPRNVSDNVN